MIDEHLEQDNSIQASNAASSDVSVEKKDNKPKSTKVDHLEHVLSLIKQDGDVKGYLSTLSMNDLIVLNGGLVEAQEGVAQSIWESDRDIRSTQQTIVHLRQDTNRLSRYLQQIGRRILDIFRLMFKNPNEASKRGWAYEQRHGAEKTEEALKDTPELFGELKGKKVLGVLPDKERKIMVEASKQTEYSRLREEYNKQLKVLETLKRITGDEDEHHDL